MTKKTNKWGGAREGAGRFSLYKGENKVRITFSLTERAVNILNEESNKEGLSRSDYLNKLILNGCKK